jgi:hypothetical protein
MIEVIHTINESIGVDPGTEQVVAKEKIKSIADINSKDRAEAQERYMVVAFIMGSD